MFIHDILTTSLEFRRNIAQMIFLAFWNVLESHLCLQLAFGFPKKKKKIVHYWKTT